MPGIDFSTWPQWAVFLLLLANLFKAQIGSLVSVAIPTGVREHFRARARRRADHAEFEQELVVAQVDHVLQTDTADQLATTRREERLLALVEKKDSWIQGTLEGQLNCLLAGQNRTNELLAAILERQEK